MTNTSPHVLIIGAGAVGALFGSALARQGARVEVVCRSDYDVVSRDGYSIRSPVFGDHVFRPHRVYRESAQSRDQSREHPDFVILCVKVLPSVDRVALLKPAVGPRSAIVLIQNGVEIEADIAAAFPNNELVSSLAFVAVGRGDPGVVNHQSLGSLTLGTYPTGIGAAAQRIAALFEAAGVPCKVTDKVVGVRWQKAVWNTAFNPTSILGGGLTTTAMLRTEADKAFIRTAMEEVCATSAAAGYPQSPRLIDNLLDATLKMPAYKTSMAQDFESHRAMEIEAILGNVVREARKLSVATPTLDALYALARMVEADANDRV